MARHAGQTRCRSSPPSENTRRGRTSWRTTPVLALPGLSPRPEGGAARSCGTKVESVPHVTTVRRRWNSTQAGSGGSGSTGAIVLVGPRRAKRQTRLARMLGRPQGRGHERVRPGMSGSDHPPNGASAIVRRMPSCSRQRPVDTGGGTNDPPSRERNAESESVGDHSGLQRPGGY